ncbi:hypothetical protein GQ53DRAFT_617958, partial [Thozetella sp. PMI_491]
HIEIDWTTIRDSRGDVLPDFSFSGYHASEIPLPDINSRAPTVIIQPRTGINATTVDQTNEIQAALNSTYAAGGGVVGLGPGQFEISPGLLIRSGVVLQGSGASTILSLRKLPNNNEAIVTLGDKVADPSEKISTLITTPYVPLGTAVFTVSNATGFLVGQEVQIERNATDAWIRANGMADLAENGTSQTWILPGTLIQEPNFIKAINNNVITLQVPLTDALDSSYMTAVMSAYDMIATPYKNLSMQIKLTNTSTRNGACSGVDLNLAMCNNPALQFQSYAVNSWAQNLSLIGFNNFIIINKRASKLTIQDVKMFRTWDVQGSALPSDILLQGDKVLIQDCGQFGNSSARCFSVMTGGLTSGPNAVLRHVTQSSAQSLYPHQRWAHGLLVEETQSPTYFTNRAENGTGQGWAINGAVGWNLTGPSLIDSPPLGINWCVGCKTNSSYQTGNGTWLLQDEEVLPRSLFLSQLKAR